MKTFDEYCKSNPNLCEPELCKGLCERFFNVFNQKDTRIKELEAQLIEAMAMTEGMRNGVKNDNT